MKLKHIVWAVRNALPQAPARPDWLAVDASIFRSVKADPMYPFRLALGNVPTRRGLVWTG